MLHGAVTLRRHVSAEPGGGTRTARWQIQLPGRPHPPIKDPCVPGGVAEELAKLSALIPEQSERHDKKLEEIHRATDATESKATGIAVISDVEGRCCCLEEATGNPSHLQGSQLFQM